VKAFCCEMKSCYARHAFFLKLLKFLLRDAMLAR